eukprot:scaffold118680_cov32-Tisochrysis_lutea.AAC.1
MGPLLRSVGVCGKEQLCVLSSRARRAAPHFVRVRVYQRTPNFIGVLVELKHMDLVVAVQR